MGVSGSGRNRLETGCSGDVSSHLSELSTTMTFLAVNNVKLLTSKPLTEQRHLGNAWNRDSISSDKALKKNLLGIFEFNVSSLLLCISVNMTFGYKTIHRVNIILTHSSKCEKARTLALSCRQKHM